jgi:hypothetical protein
MPEVLEKMSYVLGAQCFNWDKKLNDLILQQNLPTPIKSRPISNGFKFKASPNSPENVLPHTGKNQSSDTVSDIGIVLFSHPLITKTYGANMSPV